MPSPRILPNASDPLWGKTALLPGQTATFPKNYTSYTRGINGLMVDFTGFTGALDVEDFQFHVGNDNDPANWDSGPLPVITNWPGDGIGGSHRVKMIWEDNEIHKSMATRYRFERRNGTQ